MFEAPLYSPSMPYSVHRSSYSVDRWSYSVARSYYSAARSSQCIVYLLLLNCRDALGSRVCLKRCPNSRLSKPFIILSCPRDNAPLDLAVFGVFTSLSSSSFVKSSADFKARFCLLSLYFPEFRTDCSAWRGLISRAIEPEPKWMRCLR